MRMKEEGNDYIRDSICVIFANTLSAILSVLYSTFKFKVRGSVRIRKR